VHSSGQSSSVGSVGVEVVVVVVVVVVGCSVGVAVVSSGDAVLVSTLSQSPPSNTPSASLKWSQEEQSGPSYIKPLSQ